jgi:hypothetical protein
MLHLFEAGATAILVYSLACLFWPFRNCPHCHGSGRRRSPSGKAFGPCRWCKGAGRKLRVGRRIANWARPGRG